MAELTTQGAALLQGQHFTGAALYLTVLFYD